MKYLIEVPTGMAQATQKALAALGINLDLVDDLIGLDAESGTIHMGCELSHIALEINQFLENEGISPTVSRDTEDWSPEQASELIEFAAQEFSWDGALAKAQRTVSQQTSSLTPVA